MRPCAWLTGCDLWAETEAGLCFYHRKRAAGLIEGTRKPRKELRSPADVLSAEQEEMATVLLEMGASPRQVKLALAIGQARRKPGTRPKAASRRGRS